ncbi:unnamed protein product [Paramecium sonneborni]|uniref:Uncharacterized protein n=1 Tax=Paramecium sonneborni TaxID=65129 RepID=A0A8S1QYJ1_9CILI|nr:unnamed protein product [Paramecium sonneborni]
MENDFLISGTQRQYKKIGFEQLKFLCNLCNEITDELLLIQCVDQEIQVCLDCHNIINNNDNQKQLLGVCWHKSITDIPYCSKVFFKLGSQAKFYQLKFQECKICCYNKICCKLCTNQHYFCIDCTDIYIQQYFSRSYKIPCPQKMCKLELDHYLISQFISLTQVKQWKIINRDLFCFNKRCCSYLQVNPYSQINAINLKLIEENVVQCQSCKTKFCNTCYTQVKGALKKHKQLCNQLAINQFQNYCQDNHVQKCPKCRIITQPRLCQNKQNYIEESKIQQCKICNTKFCIFCKSAEVILFPQMNPNIYDKTYRSSCQTCMTNFYSYKNQCKIITQKLFRKYFYIPKILIGLCKILLIIIWLPGYQFMQVGKIVGDYVDNKINKINKENAPYFFCCCGPIIAITIICSIFILYVILFIPLFIRNCYRKINDQHL